MKQSTDPGMFQSRRYCTEHFFSEFAENLAYDVNGEFGDKFKIWLVEPRNSNKGPEVKVMGCS